MRLATEPKQEEQGNGAGATTGRSRPWFSRMHKTWKWLGVISLAEVCLHDDTMWIKEALATGL